MRFLLIWFGLIFVFFSIPRSKLGSYILPGLPPLAIVAGYGLSILRDDKTPVIRRTLGTFALINLALAAVVIPVLIGLTRRHGMSALGSDGAAAVAAVAAGAVAAFVIGRDGRRNTQAIAAIAISSVVASGAMLKARDDAAPSGSYRELARAIMPNLDRGCVLASYHHLVHSLPFYTGAREVLVAHRGELAPAGNTPDARPSFIDSDREMAELWASARCVVMIVNRKDLPALTAGLNPAPTILAGEGKKIALSNRPPVAREHRGSPGSDPATP